MVLRGLAAAGVIALAAPTAAAQECPTDWPSESALQSSPAAAPAAAPSAPRVADIRFTGNDAVDADRLRDAMVTRRGRSGRADDAARYHPARWAEDHRRLCAVLRDRGHLTARVGPPQVEDAPAADGERRVVVTIPVAEGPRYRFGQLTFEGLTIVGPDDARARFDVAAGEPYRHDRIADGLAALRRPYARRGYAEWSAIVSLRPDAERKVADVVVKVDEGLPRFVGRIVFTGHRGTLDATLRREVLLDEGDLLDTDELGLSVERIAALGYVTVRGVRLTPSERNPLALDITIEVEPRPVVRYSLAGGVNGLEGPSLTGTLGTVNLLGGGERLFASAQIGDDVLAFDVSASRPYAFGTPWSLGVQAQRDRLDLDEVPGALPAYTRDEWALRVQAQRALGRRSALWLGYSLSRVTLESGDEDATPPPGFGRRREGELSATFRFDGWDHPWKPRRGYRTTTWTGWSAGTVDFLRARTRSFALLPLGRRAAVGAGFETGLLRTVGSDALLPFDERFLLGGEMDLRGFDARSVGPTDAAGTLAGGTDYAVVQGEVHLDVTRWLRALAFVDVGQAWAGRRGKWAVSTGVEARFELPVFRLPARLIGAWNPQREAFHPEWKFRIAVGPL
jgi:outer membrane protein insertion porin family